MKIIGLTSNQVYTNRKKFGKNIIPQEKNKSAWQFFMEIFQDKINLILLGMLILLSVLAFFGLSSYLEPIGISVVLLCVGIIGTITKLKAQKYTIKLKNETDKHFYMVIRDGKIKNVQTSDIVVDDVIFLQSGEIIPADGYVIDGHINVNNAVLNGETEDCPKKHKSNFIYNPDKNINADDLVSENLLFCGTTVQSGECYMRVKKIGVNTENAKTLLSMRNINEVKTDLDIKLEKLAVNIGKFGYIAGIIVAIILIVNSIVNAGGLYLFFDSGLTNILHELLMSIIIALTIVIAAVPEGLPFIITIITAQNARNMIKHNVLAKNTNKIPEAGNIQILCTDKTGTLTYGKLIPVAIYLGDGKQISFTDNLPISEFIFTNILFNTGAAFDANNNIVGGTSTQRALLSSLNPKSKFVNNIFKNFTFVNKKPFNSSDKYSSAVIERKSDKKQFTMYTGAPEIILKHVQKYADTNGNLYKINKQKIVKIIQENARQAKRVIALAYSDKKITDSKIPDNLILTSLITIRDDVRKEVPNAVANMHKAGIHAMMLTGDILETAKAIGIDSGIITKDDDLAITANELDKMSDSEIKKVLYKLKVIARAVPKTKLRLVKIAQEMNLCIGMCGDGTNDAPALKRADVGFAMGSGTDVCKEAGDIIITDDNFISIVNAVLYGRTFLNNIKKFLLFQIPINLMLVILSIFYPIVFAVPAFVAVQILVINIIMDSLNSLSFSGEPAKIEYMNVPPQPKGASLFSKKNLMHIFIICIEFGIVFSLLFTPWVQNIFGDNQIVNLSVRFALIMIMAALNGINVRTDDLFLLRDIDKNPRFLIITLGIILGTFVLINYGGSLLQVTALSAKQWGVIIGMAFLVIPLDLVRKIIFNKIQFKNK